MSILTIIVILVVILLLLNLVNAPYVGRTYIAPNFSYLIYVIVVIIILVWVMKSFGGHTVHL